MAGRYTLGRSQMLKSSKDFEVLFSKDSRVQILNFRGLSARFFTLNDINEPPVKVAFLVSKRWFKAAVHRNLVKRQLREAFRHVQHDLNSPNGLRLAIIYRKKNLPAPFEITRELNELVQLINDRL